MSASACNHSKPSSSASDVVCSEGRGKGHVVEVERVHCNLPPPPLLVGDLLVRGEDGVVDMAASFGHRKRVLREREREGGREGGRATPLLGTSHVGVSGLIYVLDVACIDSAF